MNRPKDQLTISSKIKRKQSTIKRLKAIQANKLNSKRFKKLELCICIHEKELRVLENDLKATKGVSERMKVLFSLARALKPELTEELDEALNK